MNVLVLAPHPDDETIGCGGTLRLHIQRGDRVAVVFLTSGELGLEHLPPHEARRIRETEAAAAAQILGLSALEFLRLPDWYLGENLPAARTALAPVLAREAPALIYAPHPAEWHPDHRAAFALLAGTLPSTPPDIRCYEIWTPLAAHDEVEDITATMAAKLRAVRCYRSQLAAFRYDRATRGLAAYRGALAAKTRYAEVFSNPSFQAPS